MTMLKRHSIRNRTWRSFISTSLSLVFLLISYGHSHAHASATVETGKGDFAVTCQQISPSGAHDTDGSSTAHAGHCHGCFLSLTPLVTENRSPVAVAAIAYPAIDSNVGRIATKHISPPPK